MDPLVDPGVPGLSVWLHIYDNMVARDKNSNPVASLVER